LEAKDRLMQAGEGVDQWACDDRCDYPGERIRNIPDAYVPRKVLL